MIKKATHDPRTSL